MKNLLALSISLLSLNALSQEVAITNEMGTFHAEFSKVSSTSIVIMIPGSGGIDRDGNAGSLKGNDLLYVSDSLNAHGFSTLRTDKMNSMPSEITADFSTVRYSHFVDLASTWVDVAVDSGYSQIYVLGHSQGSLTALILGRDHEAVDGVISLCGAGEQIHKVITFQLSQQFPAEMMPPIEAAFDSLAEGYSPQSPNPMVQGFFAPEQQEFLRSWISIDPCEVIAAVQKPVLILGGSTDIQVSTDQGDKLSECNSNAELVLIEGMGHMLRQAPGVRILALPYYGRADLGLHSDLTPALVNFLE